MSENIYESLGVKLVINGASWVTVLGGSIMSSEVLQTMADATPCFVEMPELNRKAGEVIARMTGAEVGLVWAVLQQGRF